jgi:competence protein ComEC
MFNLNSKQIVAITFLAVFILIIFSLELAHYKNSRMAPLEISFLDIGQGDAILINYLHQYQILIDGGPSGKKVLTELSKVMPPFDDKIEVIIITHPDRDHFTGLIDVVKKYQVGLILINGQKSDDELWQEFQTIIKEKKIQKQVAGEGSKLNIGERIRFKFFNPDKIEENKKANNDNSIVSRLDYGDNSFLFTGDASFNAEADMIFDQEDIDVDWLKVGHHGSKFSTSKFFLARVTPQVSIISVGENDYGHPTKETLQRLKDSNSRILRTDQLGTITVICFNPNDACQLKLK